MMDKLLYQKDTRFAVTDKELKRTFIIEELYGGFPLGIFSVWTLEDMLREINRDSTCTDSYGNVCNNEYSDLECLGIGKCCFLAGSKDDAVNHGTNCYSPYDLTDWQQGWHENVCEGGYHRIVQEININPIKSLFWATEGE